VPDQLGGEVDIGGDMCEAVTQSSEDRFPPLEHEPILLGPRHQNFTRLETEVSAKRCRHHDPPLRADRDLDTVGVCHDTPTMPHELIACHTIV